MDIKELEDKLDDSLQNFRHEIDGMFPEGGSTHINDAEAHNLAYQVNAVLLTFRREIIRYLKEKD